MADSEAVKVEMRAPVPKPDATKDFTEDPHTFMNQNVFNCQRIFLAGEGKDVIEGHIRLEPTPNGSPLDFEVRYQKPPNFPPVTLLCHILQLLPRDIPRVGSVDIPRVIPAGSNAMRHVVTGSLTGCSVVVTSHPDDPPNKPTRFRAFHDRRENASIYYENVQMAFDWKDYDGPDIYNRRAAVCMHYTRQGYWVLLMQLQADDRTQPGKILRRFTTTPPIRPYPVEVRKPGSYKRPNAMKAFLQARSLALGQLSAFMDSRLSSALPIVNHACSAAPVLEAAERACRAWGETHTDTQSVITRQQLHRLIRRCRDHESIYSVVLAQEVAKDHNPTDISTIASPVKAVPHLLDHASLTTVGEKFAWLEAQYLQSYSPEFSQGFNAYEETPIPGLTDDSEFCSTSYALQDIYIKDSTLSEAAQGALSRRIRITLASEFSGFIGSKSDRFSQVFLDAGGSVTTIPLGNMYSSGATDDNYNINYVRGYPLVRAMSVAVAKSEAAVAHLGRRVVALVSSTQLSSIDTEIFEKCLHELHITYPIAGASRRCGRASLETALQKLGEVPGKALALNTNNHCMLVAVTETTPGAVKYHFYDPHFGIVSFPTQKRLLQALEKYFVEERYGNRYGAFGGVSEPEFEVVEIINAQLEGIGLSFGMTVDDLSEVERLSEVAEARRQMELSTVNSQGQELRLNSTEDQLKKICDEWKSATKALAAKEGLDSDWIPLPCTTVDPGVLFVNPDKLSAEPRWVPSTDLDNEAIQGLNNLILSEQLGAGWSDYEVVNYLKEGESGAEGVR